MRGVYAKVVDCGLRLSLTFIVAASSHFGVTVDNNSQDLARQVWVLKRRQAAKRIAHRNSGCLKSTARMQKERQRQDTRSAC